jgi:hypothetical protein
MIITENIYLIKLFNQHEEFYKIGITVHKHSRFYSLMKFGYKAIIIYMLLGIEPYTAWKYESYLQSFFFKNRYLPKIKFGGRFECFVNIDTNKYKYLCRNITPQERLIIENIEIDWR